MIVVLDTTETFCDLRLDGPNFKLLRTYCRDTSFVLVVPHIVFEETVNHFREQLSKAVKSHEDSIREIERLTGQSLPATLRLGIDEDSELQKFRSYLEAQLKTFKGKIIGCEAVDVKALVERSLQRRKPFDGDGHKGFRDAVLWETVLREVIEKCPGEVQVAFVTRNSKDFGKNDILADDLQQDCEAVGSSKNCVTLFNGLKRFIEAEVKPHLGKIESICTQIQDGVYKNFSPSKFFSDYHDVICDGVRDWVRRYDYRVTRGAAGDFRAPNLHSLDNTCAEYEVVDVWSIEEGQVAVGIDYTVDGEIRCLEQKEGLWRDGDEVFSEWYEEDHVGDATFKVSMTIILDKESGAMNECEVNDLETTLGVRWPYQEND